MRIYPHMAIESQVFWVFGAEIDTVQFTAVVCNAVRQKKMIKTIGCCRQWTHKRPVENYPTIVENIYIGIAIMH